MKKEFSEIAVDSLLLISLSNGTNSMELSATLVRHLKDNIALINIENTNGQILKFDNITINVIYTNPEGIPYIWLNSTIVYYQGQYLMQVRPDGGKRHNRRSCFRVGVSHSARLRVPGDGEYDVLVRDVSLTGFSITDRNMLLKIETGAHAILKYEDIGHELELEGNLVRIVEEEEFKVYGFVITRSCRDLSSYVNIKQRQKRN